MRIQVSNDGGELRMYFHYGQPPGPIQTLSEAIELQTVNYDGHVFSDFHARQDPATAPGWFVFGRNAEKYGAIDDGTGSYVMLCARRALTARAHRNYNGPVRRGWKRKSEAQAVADFLNANPPGAVGRPVGTGSEG